jgi:hypothetical protein
MVRDPADEGGGLQEESTTIRNRDYEMIRLIQPCALRTRVLFPWPTTIERHLIASKKNKLATGDKFIRAFMLLLDHYIR